MSDLRAGTADEAVPAADVERDAVRRAKAHCDRALDLIHDAKRAGSLGVDEELMVAVEAIRTELATLER